MKTTPSNITQLEAGQIFVFGSNLAGKHAGGAARQANEDFGAVWGVGRGIQGQAYAIPTMAFDFRILERDQIAGYVTEFIEFASRNPDKEFLVTAIGCEIAGYLAVEIAPLFEAARELSNVALPSDFLKAMA